MSKRGKIIIMLLVSALLCLCAAGGALAEEGSTPPVIDAEPGAEEPEFDTLAEWEDYYSALYPLALEPNAVALSADEAESREADSGFKGYTITIPEAVSVGEDGTGTLNISGTLYPYAELTFDITSENNWNLKTGDQELAYELEKGTASNSTESKKTFTGDTASDYQLTYSMVDSGTTLTIADALTVKRIGDEEPRYSGAYTDKLTFTYSCTRTTYTITYHGNGGRTDGDKTDVTETYYRGAYLALPASPAYKKDNATFVGWATKAENPSAIYKPGVAFTKLWSAIKTTDSSLSNLTVPSRNYNIDLYAQWSDGTTENGVTCTFKLYLENVNGGYPDHSTTEPYATVTDTLEPGKTVYWNWTECKSQLSADKQIALDDVAEPITPSSAADATNTFEVNVLRKRYYLDINASLLDSENKGSTRGNLTDNGITMGRVKVYVEGETSKPETTVEEGVTYYRVDGGETEGVSDYWAMHRYGAKYKVEFVDGSEGSGTDSKGDYTYEYQGMVVQTMTNAGDYTSQIAPETTSLTGTMQANISYTSSFGDAALKDSVIVLFKKVYKTEEITFNANNDDTSATKKVTCSVLPRVTDTSIGFTNTGKVFAGWSKTETITSEDELYQPGTKIAYVWTDTDTDHTLYAQWGVNKENYTITARYETMSSTKDVTSGDASAGYPRHSTFENEEVITNNFPEVLVPGVAYTWTNQKYTEEPNVWKSATYTLTPEENKTDYTIDVLRAMYRLDLNSAYWDDTQKAYVRFGDKEWSAWGTTTLTVNGVSKKGTFDYFTGHPYGSKVTFTDITANIGYEIVGWALRSQSTNTTDDGVPQGDDVKNIADNPTIGFELTGGTSYHKDTDTEGIEVVWIFVKKVDVQKAGDDDDADADEITTLLPPEAAMDPIYDDLHQSAEDDTEEPDADDEVTAPDEDAAGDAADDTADPETPEDEETPQPSGSTGTAAGSTDASDSKADEPDTSGSADTSADAPDAGTDDTPDVADAPAGRPEPATAPDASGTDGAAAPTADEDDADAADPEDEPDTAVQSLDPTDAVGNLLGYGLELPPDD